MNNRKLYKKEKFPYDMRKIMTYLNQTGKKFEDLSKNEMKTFLLG